MPQGNESVNSRAAKEGEQTHHFASDTITLLRHWIDQGRQDLYSTEVTGSRRKPQLGNDSTDG